MCLRLGMLDKAQLLLLSTPHGAKTKDVSMQAEAGAPLNKLSRTLGKTYSSMDLGVSSLII